MGTTTVLQFYKVGEHLTVATAPTHTVIPPTGNPPSSTTVPGLLPYSFKLPTVEQSIGLLNGLCKFEDPHTRLQGQLKEWLVKQWVPPKPTVCSPKDWSVGLCFQAVQHLLTVQTATITTSISQYHNHALHRLLWEWEVAQCHPLPWLTSLWPATVAWQPWQQSSGLVENGTGLLTRFFESNQLDKTWLTTIKPEQHCLETALWGALWQQHLLPWFDLLTLAEQNTLNLDRFPYVQRLKNTYEAQALAVQTQPSVVKHLRANNTTPIPQHPIQQLILVEGESERYLLPAIAQILGKPFKANGILVLSCGGKSATLQKGLAFLKWVKLPIAILLDADATEEAQQLQQLLAHQPALTKQLQVCILTEGELEDTYPLPWVYAVLRGLDVGIPNNHRTTTAISDGNTPSIPVTLDTRHGVPATIPSFEVFEAFMQTGRVAGSRASTLLQQFWIHWGYPSFDKRELAQGIALYLQTNPSEAIHQTTTIQNSSLWQWLTQLLGVII